MPIFLLMLCLITAGGAWGAETGHSLMINVEGYHPQSGKYCVSRGTEPVPFDVIRVDNTQIVFSAELTPRAGDFGTYLLGEFSEVKEEGIYQLSAGEIKSVTFEISPHVYDDAIQKVISYFSKQRCGASTTGYNAPCHIDDGARVDNRQHRDVSGGWHDASDLRKWMEATLYGMIGLAKIEEKLPAHCYREAVLDEMRWGNKYFQNMQEATGYVMSHCAGDVFKHGDQNRWTDNIIGNEDDRLIQTQPLHRTGQYLYIMAQGLMAGLVQKNDPEYAQGCITSASRCLEWTRQGQEVRNAGELGTLIPALLQLYHTSGKETYKVWAIEYGDRLLALQVKKPIDSQSPIRGFFRISSSDSRPYKQITHGCWPLLALCDLVENFPDHPRADLWREAIRMYCEDYLSPMTDRTAFGLVPYGFYAEKDPGGNRKIGDYWYRWFMEPNPDWWVGINANIASAGVGLVRAARILEKPELGHRAQRQLDWIVGVNPFHANTMSDVGVNQPALFRTDEFSPNTPVIPGAVMNGIGGTVSDRPFLQPGSWQNCEYWTPMVGYTVWLMAELHAYSNELASSRETKAFMPAGTE